MVSPPSGWVAVAIDGQRAAVAQVAGGGERLAGGVRMQAVEAVDQHERVAAARGHPLGGIDGALDRLVLRVGGGREVERRRGRHRPVLPLDDLLGPRAGEHEAHLESSS